MKRGATFIALLLFGLVAALPARAQTVFQSLPFPEPGWYFVSLQVDPVDGDPLAVFPVTGGFEYEHLWGYDPVGGWRHFAPGFAADPTLDSFNDLTDIEPLRGYWIRVTRVPSPGFALSVEGNPVSIQRLEGAGWHAIGALLPLTSSPENLQSVFQTLGPALSSAIPEAWGFDRSRNEFAALAPASANCGQQPTACLSPGVGYWVFTTGDVAVGQEFRIEPDELLLTTDDPTRRLTLTYSGSGAAYGTLRPNASGTGVRFRPARFSFIDSLQFPEPDPAGGRADGPDTDADLDSDGTLEPCPDLCGGALDCVNLCFSDPSREHTIYVELEPDVLFATETFSDTLPGQEFATLELDLVSNVATVPMNVVATIPLALRPPLLIGEWAGVLYYDFDVAARVPFRVWMDDCIESPGGGAQSRDCSTERLTAVINPTILGSNANALDDDGDGDVDEADEAGGVFRTGRSPVLPADVVLRGSSAGGNSQLRLEGSFTVGAALPNQSDVACVNNLCEDGSGPCSDDVECPRSAGLRLFFDQTLRSLELEGQRTSSDTFAGVFFDRYEGTPLVSESGIESSGRFTLQKIAEPQCVARDVGATETITLDLGCRNDADCPRRCSSGHPSLEGFACVDDTDCVAMVNSQQVTATCLPFTCAFSSFAGASASALDHADVALTLQPSASFDFLSVELLGSDRIFLVRSGEEGSVVLGALPCGAQELRISGNGCEPVVAMIPDVCAPTLPPIDLTCSSQPPTPMAGAPGSGGGAFALRGGVTVTGPATFQLDNPSPDCASCIARWEDGGGVPVPALLSGGAGPTELLGLGAADVVAGPADLDGFTDQLAWPPTELRSGLLYQFTPLQSGTPGP